MPKKYFFGWDNIKWLIKEVVYIFSSRESFFSKKRVESGLAFIIAQWGMIFFLLHKCESITMGEFMLWAAAEFAVSGYILNKIQQQKRFEISQKNNSNQDQKVVDENVEKESNQ